MLRWGGETYQYFSKSRTILRGEFRAGPRSPNRVHSGPIWKQVDLPNAGTATRDSVAKTPYFFLEHFLSGSDNG